MILVFSCCVYKNPFTFTHKTFRLYVYNKALKSFAHDWHLPWCECIETFSLVSSIQIIHTRQCQVSATQPLQNINNFKNKWRQRITCWGPTTSICVCEADHHGFAQGLVASLATSHHLNWCCFLPFGTLGSNFGEIWNKTQNVQV